MKIRIMCVAALLACALLSANVLAEDRAALTDAKFLEKALTCSNAEVQYSQLADKHASSEKVKEFARQMIRDHKEANQKLTEHAKHQKVAVVVGVKLDKDCKEVYDRLAKLEGKAFDREYMNQMVKDHEKAVKLFEQESRSAADADLKKFASDTLPTLRKHLAHARKVADEVKGG